VINESVICRRLQSSDWVHSREDQRRVIEFQPRVEDLGTDLFIGRMGTTHGIYDTADIEWQYTYKRKSLSDEEGEERDRQSSPPELSSSAEQAHQQIVENLATDYNGMVPR